MKVKLIYDCFQGVATSVTGDNGPTQQLQQERAVSAGLQHTHAGHMGGRAALSLKTIALLV